MADTSSTPFTPFATVYQFFDDAVVAVVQTGTASMISLITPLIAAGFAVYMMLILSSYWRGTNEDHVTDFLLKLVSWGVVITAGLNIEYYTTYIVPFVNGLGDELAGVVGVRYNSASALDTMFNGLANGMLAILKEASWDLMILAVGMCLFTLAASGLFMVIAVSYIILAKLALGILIAIGPLFIASALFPATRKFFEAWTAQCLNYAFLVMLFSFAAQIEIKLLTKLIPNRFSLSSMFAYELTCLVMLFVSLNLPSLASALAGGVGISSMVGKMSGAANLASRLLSKSPNIGGGGNGSTGGRENSMSPGARQPEQK